MKNNDVWYIVVVIPNKLLNAFVLEMELDIHFDVNGVILEVDVPIGLVTIVANTNDYGRQTWHCASTSWISNLSLMWFQHLNIDSCQRCKP